MLGPWTQLYIKEYKSGTPITPETAKRMDEQLNRQAGAMFCMPPGCELPLVNEKGEFEVRVLSVNTVNFAKFILTEHYNVKIEREVTNDI